MKLKEAFTKQPYSNEIKNELIEKLDDLIGEFIKLHSKRPLNTKAIYKIIYDYIKSRDI